MIRSELSRGSVELCKLKPGLEEGLEELVTVFPMANIEHPITACLLTRERERDGCKEGDEIPGSVRL